MRIAPSDFLEVHYIQGNTITGAATVDIDNAEKIDVGRYEYLTLLVFTNNITATTGIVITPIFAADRTSAGKRLDGTGGQPDKRITLDSSTTFDFKALAREFYVAGLPGHIMNGEVDVPAAHTFLGAIAVLGFMKRDSGGIQDLTTTVSELRLA